MDQRLRQLEPLLHAGGIFFEPAIARVFEIEIGEHLVGPALRLAARHAVELTGEGDILGPLQAGNERVCFRHVTNGAAEGCAGGADVVIQHGAAAGRRRQQAHDDLEQRRFAGAVGPEEADPARLKLQRHRAQRLLGAKRATQVLEIEEHYVV